MAFCATNHHKRTGNQPTNKQNQKQNKNSMAHLISPPTKKTSKSSSSLATELQQAITCTHTHFCTSFALIWLNTPTNTNKPIHKPTNSSTQAHGKKCPAKQTAIGSKTPSHYFSDCKNMACGYVHTLLFLLLLCLPAQSTPISLQFLSFATCSFPISLFLAVSSACCVAYLNILPHPFFFDCDDSEEAAAASSSCSPSLSLESSGAVST